MLFTKEGEYREVGGGNKIFPPLNRIPPPPRPIYILLFKYSADIAGAAGEIYIYIGRTLPSSTHTFYITLKNPYSTASNTVKWLHSVCVCKVVSECECVRRVRVELVLDYTTD